MLFFTQRNISLPLYSHPTNHSTSNQGLCIATESVCWQTKGDELSDAGWPQCRATSPPVWQELRWRSWWGRLLLRLPLGLYRAHCNWEETRVRPRSRCRNSISQQALVHLGPPAALGQKQQYRWIKLKVREPRVFSGQSVAVSQFTSWPERQVEIEYE